ncbi:MAG: glycosyltransferase family 39 protein [Candidatus Shapirobacteria bacterium]
MIKNKQHFLWFIFIVIISLFIFSYKILSIPPGLETDEGSISYNSSLISKNLRDQNGRFMPFFILSSDHLDWKQPVLIYSSAIMFKIFGTSLLNFKLVNVLYSLSTTILIYFLVRLLIKEKTYALMAMLLYSISPIIIITTRIGNESILPSFFSALWLLLLTLYAKYSKKYLMFLSALVLGIGFYSFKGMRIIVPVWSGLTILYCLFINKFTKKSFQDATIFILTILPFALIIPILESKFPGSIFDRSSIPLENYRYFIHYWLANINSFSLFSQPDIGKIYQMDYFGALLVSTLPLFIYGVYLMVKGSLSQKFILITYFLTPILFGVAKSTSYSHRLTGIVPLYVIITIFGLKHLYEAKKTLAILSVVLILLNFADFANYYYFKYPNFSQTKQAFANNYHMSFESLANLSKTNKLEPYIQSDIFDAHGDANKFFEQAYFKKSINIWHLGDPMPKNSILLTQVAKLESATNMQVNLNEPNINLLISNDR